MTDVFQRIKGVQLRIEDFILGLMDVAQTDRPDEEIREIEQRRQHEPKIDLLPERVQPGMIHGHPGGIRPGGSIHDPVDQVVAAVVVHGGDGPDAAAEEFHPALQSMQLFSLQIGIRQMPADRIVQVRESGHPVRRIVRCIQPDPVGNAETGIHAGKRLDSFLIASIVHHRKTSRGGEPPKLDVMLQEQVEGRAAEPPDIDTSGLRERFTQVRAHDTFMPHFDPERRLPQAGFGPEVQVRTQDICLMEIERILVRRLAEQFETVFSMVPVQGRREVQGPLPLRLDGDEGLQRMLELIVIRRAVEGAGPEILITDADLPGEVARPEILRTVPESLDGTEIAVQSTGSIAAEAVAALVPG